MGEELKPCPFCGDRPQKLLIGPGEVIALQCSNKISCPNPQIIKSEKEWNMAWCWTRPVCDCHNWPSVQEIHEYVLALERKISQARREGALDMLEKCESEVINILNNYPDITVDDSVRIKNEIYKVFDSLKSRLKGEK